MLGESESKTDVGQCQMAKDSRREAKQGEESREAKNNSRCAKSKSTAVHKKTMVEETPLEL